MALFKKKNNEVTENFDDLSDEELLREGYKIKEKPQKDTERTKSFNTVEDITSNARPIDFTRREAEPAAEEEDDDEYEYITPHYTLNAIMITLVFMAIGAIASFLIFRGSMTAEIRDAFLDQGYIITKSAVATADDIAEGKTAYVNGVKVIGTYVDINTSIATATADDILTGYSAYVDGKKVEGKIPVFPVSTFYIPGKKDIVIPKGYYLADDLNVQGHGGYMIPANIRKGVTIFNVTGTY